jgi:hypothetical protein
MSHASDLRDDFIAHWEAVLLSDGYAEEFRRSVDVVIDAHVKEARAPSPITEWLRRKPELHFVTSEAEPDGTIVARLHDDDVNEEFTVGVGRGEMHEEAVAAALNNAFAGEN